MKLEVRLTTLYDKVYNKDSNECYKFLPIIKKNIKLIDLKEPNKFDESEVWDAKFEYIGFCNQRWDFKRTSNIFPCTVSIGKYKPNINVNDISNLYTIAMPYMLSELVINDGIKFILLPLMYFDTTLEKIKNIKVIYDKIKNDVSENDKLYVFITEHYFKLRNLDDYLLENIDMTETDWKVLCFQILYAITKIYDHFKNFRHNKLNLQAIKVYHKKKTNEINNYKVGSVNFNVPDTNFEIRISDFDYSNISDIIQNNNTNKINDNPYYDIHYIFSSIYLFIKKHMKNIPNYLINFFDDVLMKFKPTDSEKFDGLNETIFNSKKNDTISANIILQKNIFFNDFINKTMDLSTSPIQNKRIKISRLRKKKKGGQYNSPTEMSDSILLTNKKNNSDNKLSREYNKNMIKGSRSITIPKAGKNRIQSSESDDEDGILTRAELRSTHMDKKSSENISDAMEEVARSKKSKNSSESEKKHRKSHRKSHKQKRSDDSPSLSEKKHKKQERSKEDDSSSSSSEQKHEKIVQTPNEGFIPILGKDVIDKIKKLPSNYLNEVPDYIAERLIGATGYNVPGVSPAGLPNINVPSANLQPMELPPLSSSPVSDLSSLGLTDTPGLMMAQPPSLPTMDPSLPPMLNPAVGISQPMPTLGNNNPMAKLMMNAPPLQGGSYRFTKNGNFF